MNISETSRRKCTLSINVNFKLSIFGAYNFIIFDIFMMLYQHQL